MSVSVSQHFIVYSVFISQIGVEFYFHFFKTSRDSILIVLVVLPQGKHCSRDRGESLCNG